MSKTVEVGGETYPARWEICYRCQGEGSHDAWEGGMTADEFNEQGPEFAEDYFAGRYDRACTECGGSGKNLVPDPLRMTAPQLEELERYYVMEAEDRAIAAAERRAGC